MINRIREVLGDNAHLLDHECKTIDRERLHLPGGQFNEILLQRVQSESMCYLVLVEFSVRAVGANPVFNPAPEEQGRHAVISELGVAEVA